MLCLSLKKESNIKRSLQKKKKTFKEFYEEENDQQRWGWGRGPEESI